MTIKTVIEKLNKDGFEGNIYIGSEEGSGFFYIGEYNKKEIQENYDKLDKEIRRASEEANVTLDDVMHNGMESRIKTEHNWDLKRFEEESKKINDPVKLERLKKITIRSELDIELGLVKELARLSNRIKKYEKYKAEFKPNVENAEVKEYYKKTDPNEEGMIIIIKGCQNGSYWIKSEYDARMRA